MDEDRGWRFWLTISIAAIAALFTGLGLWVALRHEAEHRDAVMTEMGIILLAVAAFSFTTWAVCLNVRDARRAKSLRLRIINIEYEKTTAVENAERKVLVATKTLEDFREEHAEALRMAQLRHAESVEEIERLKANPKRLLGAVIDGRKQIEVVGVLKEYAKQADDLNELLEKIWHLYNNEKDTRPLLYPLAKSEVPDDIKEWRHKELCRFRAFYRAHIEAVQAIAPGLHTNLIDNGFPRDSPYLEVRKDLQCQALSLKDEADQRLRSFLEAKVELIEEPTLKSILDPSAEELQQLQAALQKERDAHTRTTIELQAERERRGPQLLLEYGPNPEMPHGEGLLIVNDGRDAAFNIGISDISNGRQIARFPGEIPTLRTSKQSDAPYWAAPDVDTLDEKGFTAGSFIDAIPYDEPRPFYVTYKDYWHRRFRAGYTIVKSAVGAVTINHVSLEREPAFGSEAVS